MLHGEPEYRRRLREKAEKQQHGADAERHEAAQDARIEKVISSVEQLAQHINRYADEKSPENRRKRRWEIAEVLGLWAAAAVGVAAIWIGSSDSYNQRVVMQGQLGEMKATREGSDKATAETIAALQRQASALEKQASALESDAKTRAAVMAPKMAVTVDIVPMLDKGQIVSWRLTPRWTNAGPTEALDWGGWDYFQTFYGDIPGGIDFTQPLAPITVAGRSAVPPGDIHYQSSLLLGRQFFEDALAGRARVIIWGRTDWRDIFSNTLTHFQNFCFQLVPQRSDDSVGFSLPVAYQNGCNQGGDYRQ